MKAGGRSCRYAARKLHVRPRTLAHWRNRAQRSDLRSRLRGRPPKESTFQARLSVVELIRDTGPHLGLPTLRAAFPKTPRAELLDLQRDYRRQFQQGNRLLVGQLFWNAPGRVWAMDHAKPPSPIEGAYDSVLAVRNVLVGRSTNNGTNITDNGTATNKAAFDST